MKIVNGSIMFIFTYFAKLFSTPSDVCGSARALPPLREGWLDIMNVDDEDEVGE